MGVTGCNNIPPSRILPQDPEENARSQWDSFKFRQGSNKRLKKALGDKRSLGFAEHVNQLPNFCFNPCLSNKATIAPFIKNLELFLEDLELEDQEKIQQEADAHIVAVRVCNERRQLEQED